MLLGSKKNGACSSFEQAFLVYYMVNLYINREQRRSLLYPKEYVQYLVHFHGDRDYFECHEVLEEYWKTSTDGSKDSIWVGFILLAVSNYHHRRKNFSGAKRTLEKAIRIFTARNAELSKLGINKLELYPLLHRVFADIEEQVNYKSYSLPIADTSLLEECTILCKQSGFTWEKESNLSDLNLINKHALRDRTSVIQERLNAIENKKSSDQ